MWLLQAIPNAIDFLSNHEADRFFAYIGRDWQRQLLIAVGIPEDRLVNQELGCTYHCNDLVLKQFSHIDLVPTPLEREALARVARDVAGVGKVTTGRRLFLSRRTVTRETNGSAIFADSHACLFGALGHPFAFIFGRQDPEDDTPVQKRWTVDVEGVIQALSQYE
jgi:hypothetical protein